MHRNVIHGKEVHFGMIEKVYGIHYKIYPIFMSPGDLGHQGTARRRVYMILAHKKLVTQTHDCWTMFSLISRAMKVRVATVPSDYFIATKADLQNEAAKTARVRKIQLKENVTCSQCDS